MMLPREPARRPQLGFLFVPPFRIQGISIAGEESVVQVPELDVCFDIGRCPRAALTSPYIALTHGHMDHAAGLAYYYSQRRFQGMSTGTIVCPKALEQPIHNIMAAWVDVESQRTLYELVGMAPDDELEVKNNILLRGFATNHTVPSLGYVLLERRSKLRADLVGLPQERIVQLKKQGESVTETRYQPLVCYTGDTAMGPHFDREDVLGAKVLITECTFLEPGHRDRAGVGKHLHLDDVVALLEKSKAEAVILTHLSRRTHITYARKRLEEVLSPADRERVFLLMDSRTNRARYDSQRADLEAAGIAPDDEPDMDE